MKLSLLDAMHLFEGRVNGGSDYQWSSFPNAHCLEFCDANDNPVGSCIFSKTTYNVFELDVTVDDNAFRWVDPEYAVAYREEARMLGFNPNIAWDDVEWQDTDYLHIAVLIKDLNERSKA